MADIVVKNEALDAPHLHDLDIDRKRKSKSPALMDVKRSKLDSHSDDVETSEDIAKQYKKYQNAPKFNLNSEELFCICRRPDHGGELMIGCDGCEEWFHFTCMKMSQSYQLLIDKFYCKFCQWQGKGLTRYNKVCRLPGCMNPIRSEQRSKYCSEECGLKYMTRFLEELESLSKEGIKFALTHCKTREELASLGATFPELPEIADKNVEKLPEEIQLQLRTIEGKMKNIEKNIEYITAQQKYLSLRKDIIKRINESLQESAEKKSLEEAEDESASKKKKKKSKVAKFDLCCFDSPLHDEKLLEFYVSGVEDSEGTVKKTVENVIDIYNKQEEEDVDTLVCLQDRRKCLRHNGWWNLMADELWKRLTELQESLAILENEKQDTVRDYSIQVYEKDS